MHLFNSFEINIELKSRKAYGRALENVSFIKFQNPYFTLKPYVVDTQKNRLNETIYLSTHNIGFG